MDEKRKDINHLKNEIFKAMVNDLRSVGENYSTIAKNISLSPSAIQKIVTSGRSPRKNTLESLMDIYQKKFFSDQQKNAVINEFYLRNKSSIENNLYAAKLILLQA